MKTVGGSLYLLNVRGHVSHDPAGCYNAYIKTGENTSYKISFEVGLYHVLYLCSIYKLSKLIHNKNTFS